MDISAEYGPIGFWLFLAAIVVSGKWFDARKRETQQETLRRIVESGQQVDAAMLDKLLSTGGGGGGGRRGYQHLKIAGMITLSAAPGLAIFGYFLSKFEERLFNAMLGISLLVGMVGVGLYVSGIVSERWYNERKV